MSFVPVISEPQLEKVTGYNATGKNEGVRLLGDDPGDPNNGYFVPQTLFGAEPGETVAREEIFGPVFSVIEGATSTTRCTSATTTPTA